MINYNSTGYGSEGFFFFNRRLAVPHGRGVRCVMISQHDLANKWPGKPLSAWISFVNGSAITQAKIVRDKFIRTVMDSGC